MQKNLMHQGRKYRLKKISEVKWQMFFEKYGMTLFVVGLVIATIIFLMFVTPVASHSHWL